MRPWEQAGLIRVFREREARSSELLLHGVIRVRFTKWLEDAPYPCANPRPGSQATKNPGKNMELVRIIPAKMPYPSTSVSSEPRPWVVSYDKMTSPSYPFGTDRLN